ncbi:MAG: hypothetical protein H6706_15505 [Myxococcales bacterium]|nr:hypothetical protein [Myxococcales bacterium]
MSRRRRLLTRPLLGAAALTLTACPAEYEADRPPEVPTPWEQPPPQPPMIDYPNVTAELMLVNEGSRPQLFRIRELRPGVQLDCAGVAQDPGARISALLFGPAEAWQLDPGRAMSARPRGAGGECAAVLIDGPDLPPRLLFYAPSSYPSAWMTTEGPVVGDPRALRVTPRTEEESAWGTHPALYVPEEIEGDGPACATPGLAAGLDWSAPPSGVVGVLGVTRGADGCHAFDLEVGESPYRWFVCTPGVELPFEVGDTLEVALPRAGARGLSTDGLTIEGPRGRAALARGGDLLVPVQAVTPRTDCGGHVDACGSFVQAADVRVQIGAETVGGAAGDVLERDDLAALHLYRAQVGYAVHAGCGVNVALGQATLEGAWVERFEVAPDAPEVPEEMEDPADPGEPGAEDPADDPMEPADPTEEDPADPAEPEDPADPAEEDPADPTDPDGV